MTDTVIDKTSVNAMSLTKAMNSLHASDQLLKKKRELLELIKRADIKTAESALFQHQLHHMRDQLVA